MWRHALLAAEGVSQAFRRGILDGFDISIWNLVKLYLRILAICAVFAAILYVLADFVLAP
jgi:hypothetical protein